MTTQVAEPAVGLSTIKSKSVRTQLRQLCAEIRAINDRATEESKIKKVLLAQVGELLTAQNITKLDGEDEGWSAAQITRTSRKISAKLLAKHGVKVSVIEASTEEKESVFWSVTAKKGPGADSAEEGGE
jgi:hypothetical protein